MRKSTPFLGLLFIFGFKCGSSTQVSETANRPSTPAPQTEVSQLANATALKVSTPAGKVAGALRAVISSGSYYGDIKAFAGDKVSFHSVDYGQDEPPKNDVEDSVKDGLLIDESGEIGAPIIVFVEVADGKFPCSSMLRHNLKAVFCKQLILETDEVFAKKLATDSNFRDRFGAMLGKPFEADVKNPYFKVADVH